MRCCSRPVSHNRSRRKVVNNINTIEPAAILANQGRCLSTVLGDGNCFFRCIALASTGSDEQHLITREHVVNFMTVHAKTFVPPEFYAGEYVEHMAVSSTWATDAKIRATATFL